MKAAVDFTCSRSKRSDRVELWMVGVTASVTSLPGNEEFGGLPGRHMVSSAWQVKDHSSISIFKEKDASRSVQHDAYSKGR